MRITLFCLAVLLAHVGTIGAQSSGLVKEWIDKDLAAMKLIRVFVDERPTVPEAVLEILGSKSYSPPEELGFGATNFDFSKGYGYSHIEISGFLYKGNIVKYRVLFGDSLSWKRVRNQMIGAWHQDVGLPFQENEDSIYWEMTDKTLLNEYKAEIAKELGSIRELVPPEKLREEYEYLMSPFENSVVGIHGCGAAGLVPIGKAAIDSLVAAKQFELVKNILRGYNPGGRVFALMELQELRERRTHLEPSVLLAMNKVAALKAPLKMCKGGTISSRTTTEILNELR